MSVTAHTGEIDIPVEWLKQLDILTAKTDKREGRVWTELEEKILRIYYIPLSRRRNVKFLVPCLKRTRRSIYVKAEYMNDLGELHEGTVEENKKAEGME